MASAVGLDWLVATARALRLTCRQSEQQCKLIEVASRTEHGSDRLRSSVAESLRDRGLAVSHHRPRLHCPVPGHKCWLLQCTGIKESRKKDALCGAGCCVLGPSSSFSSYDMSPPGATGTGAHPRRWGTVRARGWYDERCA
jgi:hypothetical protein